LKIC